MVASLRLLDSLMVLDVYFIPLFIGQLFFGLDLEPLNMVCQAGRPSPLWLLVMLAPSLERLALISLGDAGKAVWCLRFLGALFTLCRTCDLGWLDASKPARKQASKQG